jgi:hypothetical protein
VRGRLQTIEKCQNPLAHPTPPTPSAETPLPTTTQPPETSPTTVTPPQKNKPSPQPLSLLPSESRRGLFPAMTPSPKRLTPFRKPDDLSAEREEGVRGRSHAIEKRQNPLAHPPPRFSSGMAE